MSKKLGILFSIFDGDAKHFDRFSAELTRLALPFAVNFDHCSTSTVSLFSALPCYVKGHVNDDPDDHFDEMHRQPALAILIEAGFDYALSLDVDETLERDAPRKLKELVDGPRFDIADFRVLDLWGDPRKYRVDGCFAGSHREKVFHLKGAKTPFYYHPTIHAPKVTPPRGEELIVLRRHDIRVVHWGIMDRADAAEHTTRWNAIYTRKVGGNPYADGFYSYINDANATIEVRDVPDDV